MVDFSELAVSAVADIGRMLSWKTCPKNADTDSNSTL